MRRVTLFALVIFLLSINSVYALDQWWNSSWHYRVKLEINATSYNRLDWPIEKELNFTKLLEESGNLGTFDINSTRVIEYDFQGNFLDEVKSQFDINDDFNATNNAIGTLVFLMNGSTPANQKRLYYVYFDILENGQKQARTYSTDLVYYWNGYQLNVNSSWMAYYIDTNRSENTSGLYRVYGLTAQQNIFNIPSAQKSAEYIQYMNQTHNFTFNLRENMTFKYIGPIRIVVEQKGNETVWNDTNTITEGFITKRYVFYSNNKWIRVEQNYTNLGSSSISRESTPAGALALDAKRAFTSYSYGDAGRPNNLRWAGFAGVITAYIHINQSGTTNFGPMNSTIYERIGIHLNNTTIPPGGSIAELAAIYFNDTETDITGARDLTDRLLQPVSISRESGERIPLIIDVITDFDFYNLGETILITANNTYDPYNLTALMNATLDMGTTDTSDDQTIILYNDGTHNDTTANDTYFTNTFNITASDNPNLWNITVKVYSNESSFLNQSTKTVNVTNIYNVSIDILTPVVFVNDPVNALIYVRNFRKDTWIAGANISCYINTNPITNQTVDYNNGTYSLSFNAPSDYGIYNLNCTASKFNNTGIDLKSFTAEALTTNMTILAQPSNYTSYNITFYVNESFEALVTTNNYGNGTAYSTNITLTLPQNWVANTTIANCGDISFNSSCSKGFLITISNNTPSGNYLVNISTQWRNPDNSTDSNTTSINVTVLSNVILNVPESSMSSIVRSGTEKTIGNFTVESIGNDPLQNINFTVIGLDSIIVEFIPSNISMLNSGQQQSIQVNVSVPAGYPPGTYNGEINITSENDGFDTINLTINVPGTNMTMHIVPSNYTANNITSTVSENFTVFANTTNIGNNIANSTNITIELPQNWTSNITSFTCGDIDVNNSCWTDFLITIPNTTLSGEYLVNITSVWFEPEIGLHTNTSFVNVTVTSNVTMFIAEDSINGTAIHGNETTIGNFTIESLGNDPLLNITYTPYGFSDLTFEFIPNITTLYSDFKQLVNINVTVPYGYTPGNYSGYLIVNTSNDGFKNISMKIEIQGELKWNMTPTACSHLETPEEGIVCEVLVNNTGNMNINFTITPPSANYTSVNVTNFTLQPTQTYTFAVLYNVTGVPKDYYNATYIVDALNTGAYPDNQTLYIYLSPAIFPLINISISTNQTHQGGNVSLYANITDQSNLGINFVTAKVTSPSGQIYQKNMTMIWNNSSQSTWHAVFPDNWGSSMKRGNYTVFIFAFDNGNHEGNATSYFIVYPNMSITLDAGNYYQGQTVTYYFNIHDVNGDPLQFANATITIKNPYNNITLNKSYVVDSNGEVPESERQFTLSSNAPTGNYIIYSNASWYDGLSKNLINNSKQTNFTVYETLGGGLFTDIETTVVWYPNNVMKFSITVYNDQGQAIDPDTMNLTVYDPADNIYFSVNMNSMTKQATGFYTYNFAMPANTSTGAYRAVVVAIKDSFTTRDAKPFRVASGGPYDVRIELLENEVPLGDYLNFNIIIENKGEVSQDVDLEYWVSDLNNTVWYYTSEAVFVGAFSNQTFPRSAFIFTNQQPGIHLINVRVTYDLVQQPIKKNTTFMVVSGLPTTTIPPSPPPPGPPGPPTEEVIPPIVAEERKELKIIEYPTELGIESGWSRYPTVKIKNTGDVTLYNIRLLIRGIPLSWIIIEPLNISSLIPNEVAIFSLKIIVPSGEKTNSYPFKIVAISDEITDEKTGILFVFSSREELLLYELNKVKEKLSDLENRTEAAIRDGKDVSNVITLINETQNMIKQAEDLIKKKDYDNALDKIISTSNLIERANQLLLKAPKTKPMILPGLPLEKFLIILIILIISITIIVYMIKKKIIDLSKIFKKPGMPEAEGIAEAIKKETEEKQALLDEKEKISKVLLLLDSEFREGIISKEAYEELKKRNMDKLEDIERKLQQMK